MKQTTIARRKPDPVTQLRLSGFDAMGHPIPMERRSRALAHVRQMVPEISNEDAFSLVQRVADALERDDPFQAMLNAQERLDVTGAYRLLAVLLT